MARPLKDGVDYFPLDVGFLQDKKVRLIKGEFGAKGVLVLIQLLCSIYGENGYFKTWDEEDCLLMSEGVGCGLTPDLTNEVIAGCVRRSIFDDRVFHMFGVLTSRGIQRRFVRAMDARETVNIIEEYWLLDHHDKDDVPARISKKLTFKRISATGNPVKTTGNPVKTSDNPQSKVEKSKVKESRVEQADAGCATVFQALEKAGFMMNQVSADIMVSWTEDYPLDWVTTAIERAGKKGKRTPRYVEGILNSFRKNGGIDEEKTGKPTNRNESFMDV